MRLFAKDLMRTAVDMVLQKTGVTPDNGNMEYLKLLGEETAKYSMAQINTLAELTAGLEKRMRKESDTYVMYGGIISAVRKLHNGIPCTGAEETKTAVQPEETARAMPKEAPAETVSDIIPLPVPKLNDSSLNQAEDYPEIPDNTGYAEDNSVPDDTDCMETDAADGPGQYEDYGQLYNGNGFMPAGGMEYTGAPDTADDAYDDVYDDETNGNEYGGNSSEDSTGMPGDKDDFDQRWEEARQNSAERNGFPQQGLISSGFNRDLEYQTWGKNSLFRKSCADGWTWQWKHSRRGL